MRYGSQKFNAQLHIDDGTYLGFNSHVIACKKVQLGKNVVFGNGVYVTDNLHGFEDVNLPILQQPLVDRGSVIIEDEAWLGEGVVVLPGVRIGKHYVIGSNSVVCSDIPEYSVAVGVPAKIIKHYNQATCKWERK